MSSHQWVWWPEWKGRRELKMTECSDLREKTTIIYVRMMSFLPRRIIIID